MASEYAVDKALIEPPSTVHVGIRIAVGGPSNLADDDRQVGEAVLFESGEEGVEVGVQNVGVRNRAVNDGRGIAVEKGVLFGEVGVGLEAEKGVDVDGERSSVVAEELYDGDHEVVDVRPEVSAGRKIVSCLVHVGVDRDCHFHLSS